MKEIVFFALALLATPAMADTVCSNAAGDVKYNHYGYNRGMPPRDGDVISTIEIRVQGKLVSKSVAYQGQPADLGPVNPDFSEIQVLAENSSGAGHEKDFSAKLVLSKNEGSRKALPRGLQLPITSYVICHERFLAIP